MRLVNWYVAEREYAKDGSGSWKFKEIARCPSEEDAGRVACGLSATEDTHFYVVTAYVKQSDLYKRVRVVEAVARWHQANERNLRKHPETD